MYDWEKIRALVEKVFDEMYAETRNKKSRKYQEYRSDFGFHMTDWLGDLKKLDDLYSQPEKYSPKQASAVIIGALYHVIPHLSAAGRILLEELPDAFAHLYHPRKKNASRGAKHSKVRRAG